MEQKTVKWGENLEHATTFYYKHRKDDIGYNILELYASETDGILCIATDLLDGNRPVPGIAEMYGKKVVTPYENRILPCEKEMFFVSAGGPIRALRAHIDGRAPVFLGEKQYYDEPYKWWGLEKLGGDDYEVVSVENLDDLESILGTRKEEFYRGFNAIFTGKSLFVAPKPRVIEDFAITSEECYRRMKSGKNELDNDEGR